MYIIVLGIWEIFARLEKYLPTRILVDIYGYGSKCPPDNVGTCTWNVSLFAAPAERLDWRPFSANAYNGPNKFADSGASYHWVQHSIVSFYSDLRYQ